MARRGHQALNAEAIRQRELTANPERNTVGQGCEEYEYYGSENWVLAEAHKRGLTGICFYVM